MDLLDVTNIIERRAEYAVYAFALLNLISGLQLATNPIGAGKRFGYAVRQHTPSYELIVGSGFTALSTALCLAIFSLDLVPPHKAIPYSLLVRSFWIKRGVDKSFRMAGMRPSGRLKILSLVMGPGSAVFLLIRPRDENAIISLVNAEMIVVSAINIFSMLLFVAPELGAPFLFGIEVSQKEKRRTKGLFRGWGNGSVLNATLMTLLLLGEVSLNEAVGYSCCLWAGLSFYAGFVVRMDKEIGIPLTGFLQQLLTAGILAAVILV
mmetsp:Transcript_2103/g.6064  ORF Transcript_2103/g.6064 Transcript_2103/m.6064 type:complete len:265 (+) Transcript_2103:91-885(+)